MQCTEERITIDASWFSAERDVRRSKGLHLSRVLDFIEHREREPGGLSAAGHAYACAGFVWERVVENLINLGPEELYEWLFSRAMVDCNAPNLIRPGEQYLDGIYLTPDFYNTDDACLEEIKYTTKSCKGGIAGNKKFSRWLQWQIPAYLKVLNLTRCRLRCYFAKGDYYDPTPIWINAILDYSQEEIDEIWAAILLNANYLKENGLA